MLFQQRRRDSLVDESLLGEAPLDFYYLFGNAIVTIAECKVDKNPSMVMIVRHPGGRTAWRLENKLKTDQEDKVADEYVVAKEPLPPSSPSQLAPHPRASTEPFGIDRIPRVKADYSIPNIEGVAATADDETQSKIANIRKLLEAQIERDESAQTRTCEINRTLPPEPASDFQTSRLFFAHLGLLELDSVHKQVKFLCQCLQRIAAKLRRNVDAQSFQTNRC